MKYSKPYLLKRNSKIINNHILDFSSIDRKTDAYIFSYGKRLPFDSENSNLLATRQNPEDYDLKFTTLMKEEILQSYDILPVNKPLLLVNRKVLDILTELCPDDFQAFPAVIVPETPDIPDFENHDYWVINITKSVDGIYHDMSDIIYDKDNWIHKIKKLTILDNALKKCHLARELKYFSIIYVSPTLVKAFKKAKVTGVKFIKDYEY